MKLNETPLMKTVVKSRTWKLNSSRVDSYYVSLCDYCIQHWMKVLHLLLPLILLFEDAYEVTEPTTDTQAYIHLLYDVHVTRDTLFIENILTTLHTSVHAQTLEQDCLTLHIHAYPQVGDLSVLTVFLSSFPQTFWCMAAAHSALKCWCANRDSMVTVVI